jgi:tagaturonate reductase
MFTCAFVREEKRMEKISKKICGEHPVYQEKILQFGEGNFLRAFVDWQIDVLNKKTDFNGSVDVLKKLRV